MSQFQKVEFVDLEFDKLKFERMRLLELIQSVSISFLGTSLVIL
jgi:hypothetical protein